MKPSHAFVFSLFGAAMEGLPMVAPSWFPHRGSAAMSSRELWLYVMGAVQFGLGAGYLVRIEAVPATRRLLALIPYGSEEPVALRGARGLAGR